MGWCRRSVRGRDVHAAGKVWRGSFEVRTAVQYNTSNMNLKPHCLTAESHVDIRDHYMYHTWAVADAEIPTLETAGAGDKRPPQKRQGVGNPS